MGLPYVGGLAPNEHCRLEDAPLEVLAALGPLMQGRGAMLAFWDDVLPPMSEEMQAEHLRIVALSLAEGGGEAFPQPADIS